MLEHIDCTWNVVCTHNQSMWEHIFIHNCRITTGNLFFWGSTLAMVVHKHIQKTAFSNHNFYEGPALQLGMEVTNLNGTATPSYMAWSFCAIWGLWTEPLELEGWLFYKPWLLSFNHILTLIYLQSFGQLFADRSATQTCHATQGAKYKYILIYPSIVWSTVCRPFVHSKLPSTELLGSIHIDKL